MDWSPGDTGFMKAAVVEAAAASAESEVPVGAVIVADYWILPRLGLERHFAELRRLRFSVPAAVAWIGALGACWG